MRLLPDRGNGALSKQSRLSSVQPLSWLDCIVNLCTLASFFLDLVNFDLCKLERIENPPKPIEDFFGADFIELHIGAELQKAII